MLVKYKLSDLARDLGVANKQVIDLLAADGSEPKKSTAILTEAELDYVFEYFTSHNQVENFNAYFASAEEKKPEPKPEVKAEEKPQPKAEEKKAEPAKAEPKAAAPEKKAEKPAEKPAEKKAEPAPAAKPSEKKPEAKPQPKAEEKKPVEPAKPAGPLKRADGTVVEMPTKAKPAQKTEAPAAPRREVVTRTVDTRTVDVNLDKFNEKYDEIAAARNQDRRREAGSGGKQKLNKNNNRFGGGKGNNFGSKHRETEAERLQRIQLEKARKAQLKVQIPDEITVGELAQRLKVTASQVIKKLMGLGVMAGITETIDFDTASLVAEELGAKVEKEVHVTIEERLFTQEIEDNDENMVERPPVVVVMGHVDHGKTSVLDAIRKTSVTKGEAGGITQHIGAYQVEKGGKNITFLDTPGHEAFTSMRARGANMTDIAVLVVAADDGIMPQTIESINHAKAAQVSIIVAINKMDKPTANPDRVKEQLTKYELVPEEWGGDVICVPVSALRGDGIEDLLEMINLTAEVKELKANPQRRASGTVVEARLDKGRGPVATLLVQSGTLNQGDIIIAGTAVGRVRVMTNDKGRTIKTAGPSTPVEITGLTEVPVGGDHFDVVADEKLARELAEQRTAAAKEEQFRRFQKVTLDNLFSQIAQGDVKDLPVVVKADVQGSAEAVKQSLEKLSNEEVRVSVIHAGVGAISKSDVTLASASHAIIIGFNVRPDPIAKAEAAEAEVELRMYRVIYDAINDVKDAMKGMLAPKVREVELGRAEVRNVFKISSAGTIAGCYVQEGKIVRSARIRLVRDGIVITEDEIDSLRRFKDDVKEVASGYECGIGLEKFSDIKEGDIFEAFMMEEYRD